MKKFATLKGDTIEIAILWANQGISKEIIRPSQQMRSNYNGEIDNELWLVDTINDSPKIYLTFEEVETGVFDIYKK